jgi:DNA-binding response OmpR family regulator
MATVSNASEFAGTANSEVSCAAPIDDKDLIVAGDFRIDLRLRQTIVRGQELLLDEDEFELLVFLTGHSTNIITPQTRLTTRWGREQVRQADFLRVLASLQRKLEALGGSSRYIRTEPWVVCRFDPRQRSGVQ